MTTTTAATITTAAATITTAVAAITMVAMTSRMPATGSQPLADEVDGGANVCRRRRLDAMVCA
jgi:hypothetical protein